MEFKTYETVPTAEVNPEILEAVEKAAKLAQEELNIQKILIRFVSIYWGRDSRKHKGTITRIYYDTTPAWEGMADYNNGDIIILLSDDLTASRAVSTVFHEYRHFFQVFNGWWNSGDLYRIREADAREYAESAQYRLRNKIFPER